MVRKCNDVGCRKQPYFNILGKKTEYFCKTHKTAEMVDVINKKCITIGCNTNPKYNMEGQINGLYCSKHKTTEMINVTAKKCITVGCNTLSNFNKEGETSGMYCSEHKTEGMIDIIHKKCITIGCNTLPSYNMEGQTNGLYCVEHKTAEMINVTSKKCLQNGCEIQPVYNMEGQTIGLYCDAHKLNGMINIKSKRCKTHLCDTIVHNNNYEGYCLRCFIHTFPDKPVTRKYKTKEKNVVDNIKISFPDFSWIEDQKISGGCSQRRPDLFLEFGSHIIIVEIDENQHTDYESICENKRMMEISQDVGHRPVVFIRFNPDNYVDDNGKKITSCWSANKLGIMTIKKCKEKEWTERINALKTQIQYCIDNPTDKTIEVVQLFY